MKANIIGAIAIVALLVGGYAATKQNTTTYIDKNGDVQVGASGSEFFSRLAINAGVINTGIVSTTTIATAETLKAVDLQGWVDSSIVSYIPILVSPNTITFPASSTIPNIVPRPGDKQSFCFRNATSTADLQVIFAGGTGTNLNVASSSLSALGSTKVMSGEVGCFTLIRQAATATTYDIDVLMDVFK